MDRIGRYKIVRELGRGAMGVVYHAIDPNIGRPVAIKTIHFGSGRKPEETDRMRERLFREARSAGMLSHPGIVTIYDVEQQGELAYIAMEYVDGPTLDQVLAESDPMDGGRMFSILGQTAVALDYAHSKGIVHRDIKPANIMLSDDGTAKIADFGIAKIAAAENLTMTGSIVGTPHYMSPEQVQGQPVDGRSDQFSLAVIAYEMLTGEKPYTGEHLTTVVYKIVAEEPVPPRRLNPSLSAGIENVLRKALSKKPDARYRNCQEFSEALEKACGAAKGWKPLPRGGLLNAMTMADVKAPQMAATAVAPVLPPPHRRSRAEASATTSRGSQEEVGIPGVPAGDSGGDGIVDSGWLAAGSVALAELPGAGQRRDGGKEGLAACGYSGGNAAGDTAGGGAGGREAEPGESCGGAGAGADAGQPGASGAGASAGEIGAAASARQGRTAGGEARRAGGGVSKNRATPGAGTRSRTAGSDVHEQSGRSHGDARRQFVDGVYDAMFADRRTGQPHGGADHARI